MLATLALLCISQSTVLPIGPEGPPGASAEYLRALLASEQALEPGKFDEAKRLAWALPQPKLTMKWDDSAVPALYKLEFRTARDQAIQAWSQNQSGIQVELLPEGSKAIPTILIEFKDSLAPVEGSAEPRGAVHAVAFAAGEPAVDTVIAVKRGVPSRVASTNDVAAETMHAIGRALGMQPSVRPGTIMFRQEGPMPEARVSMLDIGSALGLLQTAKDLRQLVLDQKRVTPAKPKAFFDPKKVDAGRVMQLADTVVNLQIVNTGNATLRAQLIPDCSCFQAEAVPPLAPGQGTMVKIHVNTIQYVGKQHKHIQLQTNDPDNPSEVLPALADIVPQYRILGAPIDGIVIDPDKPETDLYFVIPPGSELRPLLARVEGLKATLNMSPFDGMLADPELGEPETKRHGWKIHVKFEEAPPGRSFVNLVVVTNDEDVGVVRWFTTMQSGIVSFPADLYLGEVPRQPMRFNAVLSRPGKPFKVTKVTTDSADFKATSSATQRPWEYVIEVRYGGEGTSGIVQAMVTVETDDPKQPIIHIPIRAILR